MSTDLKGRFANYLTKKRLNSYWSTRINKALLKYGFENFSISILELDKDIRNKSSAFWREREDFCIKVFKPQYNKYISFFNMDREITENKIIKINTEIPIVVRNLLNKSLDTQDLDYNLIFFKFYKMKRFYCFVACTSKVWLKPIRQGDFK